MKYFTTGLMALSLLGVSFSSQALAQQEPPQVNLSAKDFYKQCKNAKSDNTDQLKLCYLDSFVELRKSGDASGKCAPGLLGLISQPHTHFMRLRATMKDAKPADDEALKAYLQRILSATYPCA